MLGNNRAALRFDAKRCCMVSPDAADPRFVAESDRLLPPSHPHGSLDVDECRLHGPGMMRNPESGTTTDVSEKDE